MEKGLVNDPGAPGRSFDTLRFDRDSRTASGGGRPVQRSVSMGVRRSIPGAASGPFVQIPFPDADSSGRRTLEGQAPLGSVGTIMKEAHVEKRHGSARLRARTRSRPGRSSKPDEAAREHDGPTPGDTVEVGGARRLRVGIVPNSTALAKIPNVFLTTEAYRNWRTTAAEYHVHRGS